MVLSTAKFIAYDMRPAKQTERRGIVEYLSIARSVGLNVRNYRYVGFGGTKFVDFQLMQKHIGFDSYQSIEHDLGIIKRCLFNRPFSEINLFAGALSDFLIDDQYDGNTVYWLDYEIGPGGEINQDITSIANRARNGDIFFISVSGELPTKLDKSEDKKGVLRSRMPALSSFINKLEPLDFSVRNFPDTVGRIMLAMLKSAFAVKLNEGRFRPRFRVIYKDSTWMVTVGGVYLKNGSRLNSKLDRSLDEHLRVMCPAGVSSFYRIPSFNFSQLERILLEKSDMKTGAGYIRKLKSIGIEPEELSAYEEVSRFIPRYAEIMF